MGTAPGTIIRLGEGCAEETLDPDLPSLNLVPIGPAADAAIVEEPGEETAETWP